MANRYGITESDIRGYDKWLGQQKNPTAWQQRKLQEVERIRSERAQAEKDGLNKAPLGEAKKPDEMKEQAKAAAAKAPAPLAPPVEDVSAEGAARAGEVVAADGSVKPGAAGDAAAATAPPGAQTEAREAGEAEAEAINKTVKAVGGGRGSAKDQLKAQQEALKKQQEAADKKAAADIKAAGRMAKMADANRYQYDLGTDASRTTGGWGLRGSHTEGGGGNISAYRTFGGARAPQYQATARDRQAQDALAVQDMARAEQMRGRAQPQPLGYDPADPLANIYASYQGRQEGGMIPGYAEGKQGFDWGALGKDLGKAAVGAGTQYLTGGLLQPGHGAALGGILGDHLFKNPSMANGAPAAAPGTANPTPVGAANGMMNMQPQGYALGALAAGAMMPQMMGAAQQLFGGGAPPAGGAPAAPPPADPAAAGGGAGADAAGAAGQALAGGASPEAAAGQAATAAASQMDPTGGLATKALTGGEIGGADVAGALGTAFGGPLGGMAAKGIAGALGLEDGSKYVKREGPLKDTSVRRLDRAKGVKYPKQPSAWDYIKSKIGG